MIQSSDQYNSPTIGPSMRIELELKVTEAEAEDVGKGFARLDPEDMKNLSAVSEI